MDIVQTFQTLGVPVGSMVFLGLAVWAFLKWMAKNVAEPLIKRHMAFLDKLEQNMESQARTLKVQAETLVKQTETLTQIANTQRDHQKDLITLMDKRQTDQVSVIPSSHTARGDDP